MQVLTPTNDPGTSQVHIKLDLADVTGCEDDVPYFEGSKGADTVVTGRDRKIVQSQSISPWSTNKIERKERG